MEAFLFFNNKLKCRRYNWQYLFFLSLYKLIYSPTYLDDGSSAWFLDYKIFHSLQINIDLVGGARINVLQKKRYFVHSLRWMISTWPIYFFSPKNINFQFLFVRYAKRLNKLSLQGTKESTSPKKCYTQILKIRNTHHILLKDERWKKKKKLELKESIYRRIMIMAIIKYEVGREESMFFDEK